MNIIEALRDALSREEVTAAEASRMLGKPNSYVGTMLNPHQHKTIQASRAVPLCEAIGYELVLRSKDDGYEFVIDE